MVLDEAQRKSPLGTGRKLLAFSQCEIQYTEGDAVELSREVSRKLEDCFTKPCKR